MRNDLRHTVRCIGLNVDLKSNLIILHKAPLRISHILKWKHHFNISYLALLPSDNTSSAETLIKKLKKRFTYTPWHEVGKAPVIFLVEEQVTNAAAEGFLIIFVVDYFEHGLSMAWPGPKYEEESVN